MLSEVSRAGSDQARSGRRLCRKVFGRDWQLGSRNARQPDGDLSMSMTLVNPCDEHRLSAAPAPRLHTLAGKTVALLDISKPGGSIFLDRLERLLQDYGVSRVVRVAKPTYTKPAPEETLARLRDADAVVEALAD